MNRPDSFIFKGYAFNKETKTLELKYGFSGGLEFTELYHFDFDFVDYDEDQLNRALMDLMLMAGVSYFKAYAPAKLEISGDGLNAHQAEFYSKTYQKGLGEFWYVNKLDPSTPVEFKVTAEQKAPLSSGPHAGMLVGIGGGKDSLLVAEALRSQNMEFMTWSLNHRQQLEPLVERLGAKHAYVDRTIDPKLLELNKQGAYNGHVPISAIIGSASIVVAILTGRRDVVVGNEQTANEPTLHYMGQDINHQYSKSQEFERDFQKLIKDNYANVIRYYSFLRPLSELFIAEIFSKVGFSKYKDVFSSCNRAYTLHSDHMYWCGQCPKCAFMFMLFTPFIKQAELESLWHGKNLLLDPELKQTYRQLLGIEGDKPLDCVGEIKESRSAMKRCFRVYPELESEYQFELPDDYDYRSLGASEMPEDIQRIFDNFISGFVNGGQQ